VFKQAKYHLNLKFKELFDLYVRFGCYKGSKEVYGQKISNSSKHIFAISTLSVLKFYKYGCLGRIPTWSFFIVKKPFFMPE